MSLRPLARAACMAMAVFAVACSAARAADHRVEPLDEAAPSEDLSPAIAELLSSTGFKVISGKSRTVCEVWPAQEWKVREGFEPSSTVLYPFEVGELIGAIRYKRKGEDFRGQTIPAGTYTLRYAQQPVDGNHVGTSDTRDFLLLAPAKLDTNPAPIPQKDLFKLSAKAVSTPHPAMLCLLAAGSSAETLPAIAHSEASDLWSVLFAGQAAAGEKKSELPLKLVVVGHAPE